MRRVADRDALPVDRARDALAGRRLEVGDRRQLRASLLAPPRPSPPPAGARSPARGSPRAQHLVLGLAPVAGSRRPAWAALGERSGLVDDQRVDLLQTLERFGIA